MDDSVKNNLDSLKSKSDSWDIYETLRTSLSVYIKSGNLECLRIIDNCLEQALAVLLNDDFCLTSGSRIEGTNITPSDYHADFTPPCVSDTDTMSVWYSVRVIEEGEALPEEFANYIYCRAERGKHTTDGFRKLRILHNPECYLVNQDKAWHQAARINRSIENGYISSTRFMAYLLSSSVNIPLTHSVRFGLGMKGPSSIVENDGSPGDLVRCFYVKTWPKEAESWFTRHTHWPDKQLKNKIKKIGYLLVPTGNSKSKEFNLEWRSSFSIAEQILFQSVSKFQRYTFVMLKVLMKEYMPLDINTDGDNQVLSTYHFKTVFLWCLEDSQFKWEPENMLDIIHHMLDVLVRWIKKENFPHYFIPSVNLLDVRRLHGRKNSLMCVISAIRNDLSNKIRQSQFFRSQEISASSAFKTSEAQLFVTCYDVMKALAVRLQCSLHDKVFQRIHQLYKIKLSYILLIEVLISIKYDRDTQVEQLYKAVYTDPCHYQLLMEVVPGLYNQYCGCIHLAMYCIAERDSLVYPTNTLQVAESLLKDTLHLDPCSGYVKLACLYIATGDFVQAMDKLDVAESNFLHTYLRMRLSARIASEREGVEVDSINTDFIREVFWKWAEGQLPSNMIVTWLEYTIVPDLLQFELIHESTQQLIDSPLGLQEKMVGINCYLGWPPLSMIKLLKFVCSYNSGQVNTSHLANLVSDLIVSSLSVTVAPDFNDIYTIFNMAAWCYIKIRRYRRAAHMITAAIGTRSEIGLPSRIDLLNRCAFCHHFLLHVIAHCLS